ncbi:MAG: acyl-CoA thioesterase [Candidatus Omnitrophica bacterium]|nr:acyl-CoA thioesterase [Candidatus Omnitrophota bacterium]
MVENTATIRVRYKETDQMQVVYYSNYLVWFEVARTELFRERGHLYSRIEKELGLRLMVVEAQCRYLKPAKYDDLIDVDCRLSKIGASSLVFEYIVKRGEDTLAEGKTVHVFTDANAKPKRMPDALRKALE